MKKGYKILLVCILVLIIGGMVFLCINTKKDKETKGNNKNNTPIEKVEYYKAMHKKMHTYYEIMYRNINVPEDKKDSVIRINLGSLKREGYPMEEFVSYDDNEECDLSKSYAVRKVVNNKYKIEVFYKCGNDANYDYTKTTQTKKIDNSKTTSKKSSSSREEAEKNKNNIRENRTTRKVNN